jgi:hypothetical protein
VNRRVFVERHIAADPASVALLLAGAGEEHDLLVAPPRRSGVEFIAAVATTGADGEPVEGVLRISPAEEPGCDVRVSLRLADDEADGAVRRAASKVLATLALRARERSFAA